MFIRRIHTNCFLARASVATGVLMALTWAGGATPASAEQQPTPPPVPTEDVYRIVGHLQLWLVAVATAVATLLVVAGGVLYMISGGNPTQIERAKTVLRSVAIGYGIVMLASALVQILRWILS